MSDGVEVRCMEPSEKPACETILRSLPDWFGIEEALLAYVNDIATMETFGAWRGADLLGFVTLKRHFDHAAEIHVMAVRAPHHRRVLGRALLHAAERGLREAGVRWLQVKTLGPSHADEGYRRTRAFYEALGYEPIEESDSRWPGNPCLQMIKSLS